MSSPLYDIPVDTIDGEPARLSGHAGEVLLLVNVASKCGLTPQYTALQEVFQKFRDRGFSVLGFPANNFLEQEPGSNAEIQAFCESNYHVEFPLYAKLSVAGADQHPLYAYLTGELPDTESRASMEEMLRGYGIEPTPRPEVVWNFEKFLVSRQGEVVRRFAPSITPDAPEIIAAIEQELERA